MAALIRPKRWGQQKPSGGSQLDMGHPLAQGLVGAWLFNEQGGGRVSNLAGPLQGQLVSTYNWGPESVELSNDTAATGRTNLGDIRITGDMTVLCSYMPLRISASFDVSVISKYDNGARPANCEWILGGNLFASAGDARQFFGISSGTTLALAGAAAGDTATVGTRYALAGTRRGTALTVYRNGKIIGSTTGPSGAINTGTGRVVKLGEIDNGAGNNSNSRFYYAYLWNRALTQSELQWLYAEPYAFIVPQVPRQRVWVPSASTVSASGTATLDLTASGAAQAPVTSTASLSLTASATAQAPATSGASLSLTASATASAAPTATATLDLTAAATGSATPTGTASLTLTASSTATATPTATASITLNASATPSTTATASLTLTATATGAAAVTSTASITLLATGTGAALVGSTATLTLIAAGGVSAAITSAAMLTLTASGIATSFVSTPTPPERTYRIPAENRVYLVPAENRTYRVPAENRVMVVT